jgi:hypothetical protein
MQSISEQSDRAMGLVKAAHSSWKHSEGSDEETTELRQEFEARLTELATHGFQAVEYAGSLVFARAPVEDGEYTADCLVCPRDPGSTLASTPVPLSSLTRVYICDPALQRNSNICDQDSPRIGWSLREICGFDFCFRDSREVYGVLQSFSTVRQVSGEAQFGGAPPRNELIVGGGGPAAAAAAGSCSAGSAARAAPRPPQLRDWTNAIQRGDVAACSEIKTEL